VCSFFSDDRFVSTVGSYESHSPKPEFIAKPAYRSILYPGGQQSFFSGREEVFKKHRRLLLRGGQWEGRERRAEA